MTKIYNPLDFILAAVLNWWEAGAVGRGQAEDELQSANSSIMNMHPYNPSWGQYGEVKRISINPAVAEQRSVSQLIPEMSPTLFWTNWFFFCWKTRLLIIVTALEVSFPSPCFPILLHLTNSWQIWCLLRASLINLLPLQPALVHFCLFIHVFYIIDLYFASRAVLLSRRCLTASFAILNFAFAVTKRTTT